MVKSIHIRVGLTGELSLLDGLVSRKGRPASHIQIYGLTPDFYQCSLHLGPETSCSLRDSALH